MFCFSADVAWAKQNGARIERFNLAQEPLAFADPIPVIPCCTGSTCC